jgi:hypothetical protein
MTSDLCTKCEAHRARLEERIRCLEQQSSPPTKAHDPIRWRRQKLRWLRRVHYAGQSRYGAATAISIDWRAYVDERQNERPQPGSKEAGYSELIEAGCRPLGPRTIFEDLYERQIRP